MGGGGGGRAAMAYLGYGRCPGRHLNGGVKNRFVFDICYPIDIFNGLNFGFVR